MIEDTEVRDCTNSMGLEEEDDVSIGVEEEEMVSTGEVEEEEMVSTGVEEEEMVSMEDELSIGEEGVASSRTSMVTLDGFEGNEGTMAIAIGTGISNSLSSASNSASKSSSRISR